MTTNWPGKIGTSRRCTRSWTGWQQSRTCDAQEVCSTTLIVLLARSLLPDIDTDNMAWLPTKQTLQCNTCPIISEPLKGLKSRLQSDSVVNETTSGSYLNGCNQMEFLYRAGGHTLRPSMMTGMPIKPMDTGLRAKTAHRRK